MILHWASASPFVRKVMVVLHETDQLDDVELASATGTAIDASAMPVSANPLGKIPVLERTDGPAIYDSRVICRFFDDRANSNLYPGGNRLWDILTLESTADGIMDSAVLMVYEARTRPDDMQFAPWVEGHWDKVRRSLATLNTRWISHLEGPLNMGQIAVGCALGYLDFRHDGRNWRQGNDALAGWYERFSERQSMQATDPTA